MLSNNSLINRMNHNDSVIKHLHWDRKLITFRLQIQVIPPKIEEMSFKLYAMKFHVFTMTHHIYDTSHISR